MKAKSDRRRNAEVRAARTVSLDGLAMGNLAELIIKARADADRMGKIADCATCGEPWTSDLVRHQRAIMRGATPDVLVCVDCR